MYPIFKFLLPAEVTLGTANNVGGATLVRIANPTANVHVVTQKDASGTTTISTFTVRPSSEILVKKGSTDTLAADSGTDLKAQSVAF